jgi:hypothetical protein
MEMATYAQQMKHARLAAHIEVAHVQLDAADDATHDRNWEKVESNLRQALAEIREARRLAVGCRGPIQ